MVVFRATQKLRGRMGATTERAAAVPRSNTRLGDWYAKAVAVRRQHLLLAASGVTLLPVVLPAAPYKTMLPRFAEAAGQVLRALEIDAAQVAAEVSAMREPVVAPTDDRRVLGSMNDFAWMMEAYVEDAPSLLDVALELAEAPCGPLGMNSPREATVALFSAPALRLVRQP